MSLSRLCAVSCAFAVVFLSGSAQCRQNSFPVTVTAVCPPSTPPGSTIFLAGNSAALGDWNPGSVQMKVVDDSVRTFTWSVRRGETVEFKLTRGSWTSQAVYVKGTIPDNIRFRAVRETLIVLRPVTWSDLDSRPGSAAGVSGTARYHRNLLGEGLRYARDVVVWLPPSYERDPARRFPVLYMHDGQNVFDPGTSFLGYDWRVDEVADSLIRKEQIEEIIIVGISNTPDRVQEYSDTERGRAYARFVATTVKSLIDSTYRTKIGPKHTAVMGSSMGGLISFLFVWWHPEVFLGAGCLSGAFSFDNGRILREVRTATSVPKNIRVYLDCGTEDLEARLKPGYEEMVRLLEGKGFRKGVNLDYYLDPGATHNEPAWAGRVWRPLRFLFGQ